MWRKQNIESVFKKSETAVAPENPEREGYIFDGWYSDSEYQTKYDFSSAVTKNIKLYAKWKAVYIVSFDSLGGSDVDLEYVLPGETAFEPEFPTKEGYVFVGWYKDSNLQNAYDFSDAVNSNLTLYAKWNEAIVNISLNVDTNDCTVVEREITGSVEANLYIEGIEYELKSENKTETGEIKLQNASNFKIKNLLEDGINEFTVTVQTADGGKTKKSVEMTYDRGDIIDYSSDAVMIKNVNQGDALADRALDANSSEQFVANVVNIFFVDTMTTADKESFVTETLGGTIGGKNNTVGLTQVLLPNTLNQITGYSGTLNLTDISNYELQAYVDALKDNYGQVEYAYIDYIRDMEESTSTDDPWDTSLFNNSTWWRDYVKFPEAWDFASWNNIDYYGNSPITLGVVDNGFMDEHEDLNGMISIISNEDNQDDHGTHVAGIIAAKGNNGKGITGGTYNKAKLVAYDASSDDENFSDTEIYNGLSACVEAGAKVVNFSLGCSGKYEEPNYLSETDINYEGGNASYHMARLLKDGYDFIVVKSAGNAGIDSKNNGNFSCINEINCQTVDGVSKEDILSRVLVVSAINGTSGTLAKFSGGGTSGTTAIAAPGTSIYSCIDTSSSSYEYYAGTSMAAPIVTATAGLVWAANKNLTGSQVVLTIYNNTQGDAKKNTSNVNGTNGGMGIVDAYQAVEAAIAKLPQYYGKILDATTGNAVQNAIVKIYNSQNERIASNETYKSDSNGKFYLPKLPNGAYTIEISASGYAGYTGQIVLNSKLHGTMVNIGTYGLSSGLNENAYRIVLRWTNEPADLDSHLVAKLADNSSYHVAFFETDPEPRYANLDRDDVDYEGPETITILDTDSLKNMRYAVHDYTNRGKTLSNVLSNSGATVQVYKGNALLASFSVPVNVGGTEWDVFAFDANLNIHPINSMKYCEAPINVLSLGTNLLESDSGSDRMLYGAYDKKYLK